MRSRLTHLNALRAFEATARLGSYVRAGAELGVTPAAVGQHVRQLEEQLGAALFERQGKRMVLTEPARAALPDIKEAFDRLAQAADRLRDSRGAPVVTITLPPSFAAKWLIPRIEAFRMAHTDVDLRLDTTDRLADLARENIALGIRYGGGRYPGLDATLLMPEEVYPACSPALLGRVRRLREPDDLAHFKLIHDTTLASVVDQYSQLDHPELNARPGAIAMVVHAYGSGGSSTYHDYPIGLDYFGGRWYVRNEDTSAMPPNRKSLSVK